MSNDAPFSSSVPVASTSTAALTSATPRATLDLDRVDEPSFAIETSSGGTVRPVLVPQAEPARPVAAALPIVDATPAAVREPTPEQAAVLRARIDVLVGEARAAKGPSAAPLWFEAGRIFEHDLLNLREAATHYQESHKADPTYVPVMHAARRLFAHLGKWSMVVVLIDQEAKTAGAPTTSLTIEKARILEGPLARADDALALYREILAREPAHPVAVDAIVRGLTVRGAWSELVDVLASAAAVASRPTLQAAWLLEAARVVESRLHDDARALTLVQQADALVPHRRASLEMLLRLHARTGDGGQRAVVLEKLADLARAPGDAVAFLSERARVLEAHDEKQAVAALEEARERVGDDTLVLAELARLYARLQMWSSLVEVNEARAGATQDPVEKAALLADAARTADEKMHDAERALALYRASLAVSSTSSNQPAIAAIGRLCARTLRFRELVGVYDLQLSSTTEPPQRVPLLFRSAEVLAEKLDDVDAAVLRLQEVLALAPGYAPALRLASSLFTRLERWEDLLSTLEAELRGLSSSDREQSLFALERIAQIAEERLHAPERAIDAWQRMLQLKPGHLPALRSLVRLYAEAERHDDHVRALLEESQGVSDPAQVVALLAQAGEVLADKLNRVDDGIDSFKRALALMPNYLPALKALGSIYARAGRWSDLIAMHREEADVARSAEQRARLRFLAAELTENRLDDDVRAISAYREVLDEEPRHHAAIRALQRLAAQRGDVAMQLEMLHAELAVIGDARDRALHRCRIAELLERQLQRPDDAIAALRDAIADAPALRAPHEQLIALLSRCGRAADEAAAREALLPLLHDVEARIAQLRTLCEHALHRVDDPARALDFAHRLLAEIPDDRAALRLGLTCALRMREHRTVVDFAQRLARIEPSATEVVNLHLQIAAWKEGHLDPPGDPLPDYVRILEFDAHNPIALRALERLYVERGAWGALFALYDRAREVLQQPALVVDNAMKMGEIADARLGKPELAQECFERALVAAGDYLPAIRRLQELHGRQGRPQDQLRLLTLEARTSKDPARAIQTLLEVGALQRDKFHDVDAAVDCFERVLDRDALHTAAHAALEQLLVDGARWEQLAALYARRADALGDVAQKVALLGRAAQILVENVNQLDAGARMFARVLDVVPGHVGALGEIGSLRFALREWDAAIAAYTQMLPLTSEPTLLVPAHFNLGVIFVEHKPDPARAIQHLSAGLSMQPENRPARRLLAIAHMMARSPAPALALFKQLADTSSSRGERAELHRTIAQLYETVLPDPAQQAVHLEAAMALTDDHDGQAALLQTVIQLYERTGNVVGYVDATLRHAESIARSDPRRAAAIHHANARILLERQGNLEGAIRSVRRALDLAPDELEYRGVLADLYGRAPGQGALALEEHRRVLRAGRVRVASLHALFAAWEAARAYDRAYCVAELLSFLGAGNDGEELFAGDNRKRARKDSVDALDDAMVGANLVHPAHRNPVRAILALAAPDLGKPLQAEDLEALDKKFILKPRADDPLRHLADNIAHNYQTPAFDLWRSQVKKSGVDAIPAATAVLLVGLDLTRTHQTREQRFLLGRKLFAMHAGFHLLRGLDVRGCALLVTAIARAVDKAFPALVDGAEVDALTKKVANALSRKARAALAEPVAQLAMNPRSVDLKQFLAAIPFTEARAGLVVSGIDVAVRLIARDSGRSLAGDASSIAHVVEQDPVLSDLVAWSLSDEFFAVRAALHLNLA